MPQATTPHFLGFDVRLDPANFARGWSTARRAQFLLRDDIDVPISIDPMVWPSKFWQRHVPPGIGIPRHLGTVAVPDGTAGYTSLGLWTDLDELRRFASQVRVSIDGGRLIAILVWPDDERDIAGPSLVTSGSLPDIAGWTTLGFDVADDSFVSGLNNCGYEVDERPGLAAAWKASLNQHGLLNELDAALRFADLTDARVPEHAPFLVFELRAPGPGESGML
jgi:hypothetical protein